MKDLFDMFEWIEYPENTALVEGLQNNVMYDYVSTTYLNGFINYVDIIKCFMIRHYGDNEEWKKFVNNVDSKVDPHTDLSDSDKYDDVIIIASSGDFYIIFWSNCDCSNSSIGKISKSCFESDDDVVEALKTSIKQNLNIQEDINDDNWDNNVKEIPKSFFSGWITL